MDLNQLGFGGSVSKGGGPRRSPWMVNLNQTSSTTAIIIDFQGPFSYTAQLISGTFIDYITNWSAARQSVISSSSRLPTFSNQGDLVFVQTPTIVSFNTQAGNDLVFSVNRNATLNIHLGAGNDMAVGGFGNDTVFGDRGDDLIDGSAGSDLIRGGQGNDTLYGNVGDDTLFGDAGDDRILSGNGNDKLYGGTGNDQFVFDLGNYSASLAFNVTIADFGSGDDKIDLSSFKLKMRNGQIVDPNLVIQNDNNVAKLFINTFGKRSGYELNIRVEGLTYDQFVNGISDYLIVRP